MTTAPVLHLLAGPNGAGKTTFYELVLAPLGLDFVNADLIAATRWPGDEAMHAYDASAEAAAIRDHYLVRSRSFATETVFSHPSKIALVQRAADAGYLVHMHVLMVPVDVAVARVSLRVDEGGHAVPEDKIRQRHARLWAHVVDALAHTVETRVYDSSGQSGRSFVEVARYRYGRLLGDPDWPTWAPTEFDS